MAWGCIRTRYVALICILIAELVASAPSIAAQGDYTKVEDLAGEVLRRLIADTRLQGARLNPDDPAQIYLSRAKETGGLVRVDVTNLLAQIRHLPQDQAEQAIGQFVEGVAAGPQSSALDRTRIYANVRPRAYVLQDGQDFRDALVFEELAGDLIVLYQIDEPQALRALNWSEVGDLNLDQLKKIARDNLSAQLGAVVEERLGDQVSIFVIKDNPMLSPALLLSDWFFDHVAKRFPGGYIVGVPQRDFVIVFDTQQPEALHKARQVMDEFARDQQNFSSTLLLERLDGKLVAVDD